MATSHGVASARGNVGQLLSSEITTFACRPCPVLGKATSSLPLFGEAATDAAESAEERGSAKRNVGQARRLVIGFERPNEATSCLEVLRTRERQVWPGASRRQDASDRVRSLCDGATSTTRRGPARNFRFSWLHTPVCQDTEAEQVHDPSIFDGQTHACDLASDQSETAKANAQATWRWRLAHLRRAVGGWLNYHAIPSNSNRIGRFVDEVTRLWLRVIRRRSQRGRCWTPKRMHRLVRKHLPRPRIIHPYPDQRFHARLEVGAV